MGLRKLHLSVGKTDITAAQQGAAPDRLQLRSSCLLTSLPAAGELVAVACARLNTQNAPDVIIEPQMIDEIRNKIAAEEFEYSKHAVDQSILRHITIQEVREAVASAEIIENYPNDKYGPSCLILGFTLTRRPLHIQCSHPSRSLVKIITLYEPDADLWVDFKVRKD